MLSHHSANFSGHAHCGSEDIMFLVVDAQNFTHLLSSTITVLSKANDVILTQMTFRK